MVQTNEHLITFIYRDALDSGKRIWHDAEKFMKAGQRLQRLYPKKATSWALVATPDATSWIHVDCEGTGTVVVVLHGLKLWVVATPKTPGGPGDFSSIKAIPEDYNSHDPMTRYFDFEPILLGPGDCLYVQLKLAVGPWCLIFVQHHATRDIPLRADHQTFNRLW